MGIWARGDRGSRRGAAVALALAMGSAAGPAWAYPTGISGYSGNPGVNGGSDCTSCHTDAAYTIATSISGSTTVAPGALDLSYTISATGTAGGFGFNVSTTGGTLVAVGTDDSRLTNSADPDFDSFDGELTHISPKASASWTFKVNAPSSVGTFTLYGCINPVNLNGTSVGDGAASCNSLAVTVNTTPTAAGDTVNVNEDSGASADLLLTGNDSSGASGGSDPGDSISITAINGSASGTVATTHGSVSRSGNVVRYTPAFNYNGADSFTYTISDSQGATATATVSVTEIGRAHV